MLSFEMPTELRFCDEMPTIGALYVRESDPQRESEAHLSALEQI